MPFTTSGYVARRFPEIQNNIRNELQVRLGTPISATPNTVLGNIIASFANQVAEQENATQALYSNLDVDTAEGVYLDKLVGYIGLTRSAASPASGQLKVWRTGVGTISSSFQFESTEGVRFITTQGLTHTLSECAEIMLRPNPVADSTTYEITINGNLISYTSGVGATRLEISTFFRDEINAVLGLETELVNEDVRIIADIDDQNNLSVDYLRMTVVEIASFNFVESVDVGEVFVEENTITSVITPSATIVRCNNPLPFVNGRSIETDEELRARFYESQQVAGVATVPAIRSSLRNLPNVIGAAIVENTTFSVDSEGRPPKSYESIVEGGNPIEIADTIWNTKPAGVETYGNIESIVVDASGVQQVVKWSRPTPIYTHVRVTYSLYDEEDFPSNGENAIREAVLEYGLSLGLDEDVIPTRFIGPIYRNVSGLDTITVEVGTSALPTATVPDSGWLTTSIPVGASEFAAFASARIVVGEQ